MEQETEHGTGHGTRNTLKEVSGGKTRSGYQKNDFWTKGAGDPALKGTDSLSQESGGERSLLAPGLPIV